MLPKEIFSFFACKFHRLCQCLYTLSKLSVLSFRNFSLVVSSLPRQLLCLELACLAFPQNCSLLQTAGAQQHVPLYTLKLVAFEYEMCKPRTLHGFLHTKILWISVLVLLNIFLCIIEFEPLVNVVCVLYYWEKDRCLVCTITFFEQTDLD